MLKILIAAFFVCSSLGFAHEIRLIETSDDLAQIFLKTFPDDAKIARASKGSTVLFVSQDILPALSREVHSYAHHCGGFMDVTDERRRVQRILRFDELPMLSEKRDDVVNGLGQIKSQNIEAFTKKYSDQFTTRAANSETGAQAPEWLKAQWQSIADQARRTDVRTELVSAPRSYDQKTVHVLIPGSDASLPHVILGAHLDSINWKEISSNRNSQAPAPGSDDDASGIATLTEVYRILLSEGRKPKASIEIFGYAAEELGLLGSRLIAERYSLDGVKVRGVLQLDMVAYPGESRTLTFMDDYVDAKLSTWTEQLYGLYVGGAVSHDRCGYGCSDHASWSRYGFPAVMPFEAPMQQMNHRIHSRDDVWDQLLDAEFATQFAKLAYAFTVVLADEK